MTNYSNPRFLDTFSERSKLCQLFCRLSDAVIFSLVQTLCSLLASGLLIQRFLVIYVIYSVLLCTVVLIVRSFIFVYFTVFLFTISHELTITLIFSVMRLRRLRGRQEQREDSDKITNQCNWGVLSKRQKRRFVLRALSGYFEISNHFVILPLLSLAKSYHFAVSCYLHFVVFAHQACLWFSNFYLKIKKVTFQFADHSKLLVPKIIYCNSINTVGSITKKKLFLCV